MLPPFRVSFVEVQRRGLKYARELVRAAVYAVEARDAEIARLRAHIATLEAARRVSTYTVENPAATPLGLWTMHGDRPRLEMFARERTPGWSIWGNQAPGGSDVEILPREPGALAVVPPASAVDPRQITIFDLGGVA